MPHQHQSFRRVTSEQKTAVFQLTLALRYVNKLLCQRVKGQFDSTPLTTGWTKKPHLPKGVVNTQPGLFVRQDDRLSWKSRITLASVAAIFKYRQHATQPTLRLTTQTQSW